MRAIIYPYDSKSSPFVLYEDMLKDISIDALVAPEGFGNAEKIVSLIGNEYDVLHDLNENMLNSADAVLIVESYHLLSFDIIRDFVQKATAIGLNVYCIKNFSNEEKDELETICRSNYVKFVDCIDRQNGTMISEFAGLSEVHTPIVAIAGAGERCSQLNIQMRFARYLKGKGYSVKAVLPETYDVFADTYPFPGFMINSGLDERSKVINYNLMLKEIEKNDVPDVILVAIPGEMMPLTRHKTGNFGIVSYEIFNAISPDFMAVSLYRGNYADTYFDEFDNLMKYRFNTNADCFFITSLSLDRYTVNSDMPLKYLTEDREVLDRQCRGYKHHVYSDNTIDQMAEYMETILRGYAETEII